MKVAQFFLTHSVYNYVEDNVAFALSFFNKVHFSIFCIVIHSEINTK